MDGPWPLRICGMRCGVRPVAARRRRYGARRYGQANTASPGAGARAGHGRAVPAGAVHYGEKACSGNLPGTAGAERVFRRHTDPGPAPATAQAAGRDRLHRVRTAPSPLQDLFGETLVVNSAHHQAADRLGQGLRAVQWAIDGTVEAVIHQSLPGVGCPVAPGAAGRPLIPVRSRRWRVPFHRLAGAGWWHRTILEKNCGFPLDRWACPW